MDLRQSKRYRLTASATFSWKAADGQSKHGEGFTRDISPSGVFILTSAGLPSGTAVELEVALPSLHGRKSGALLHTVGHVVRSEVSGFAAAADMGFRMQIPDSLPDSFENASGHGNGRSEVHSRRGHDRLDLVSRFSM